MPYSLQKKTLLCNKLSILALVLALISSFLLTSFQIKGYYTGALLLVIAACLSAIPLLNRMNQVTFTRLALSISAPVVILIYTMLNKFRHPDEIESIDYFGPRALIFLTILLPLVLLDFKQIFQMTIGLGTNLFCLIFFDKWHAMLSIDYPSIIPLFSENYSMINAVYLLAASTIIMAFYFYQHTNDHFESENQKLLAEVRKSNTELKEEKKKLQEAYRELKIIDEEIRQNSEELQAINDNLVKTRDELRISFEREKEINEKLAKANEDLKFAQLQVIQSEKMASLGQLTAGVAHEINNPINFVYAGVSTLKSILNSYMEIVAEYETLDQQKDTQKIQEVLRKIRQMKQNLDYDELKKDIADIVEDISEGATRTAEIVKGLRNFSRLDEEHMKMANINECLESTLVILSGQFKDHIAVVKDYDENLPSINCYPGQLNQVFLNILNNARQAITNRGEIRIKTLNKEGSIQVKIQDTGVGIPKELKDRIFEPFFTTKEVGEGTGLGLSISYGIIEKHKGKIHVESELGKGTEFTIELSKSLN